MGSAKIELVRTSQRISAWRDFDIYIDNKLKIKISNESKKIIELDSGEHTIFAKIDWLKSKKITLNLKPGSECKLICGSKIIGWKKNMILFYVFSKNEFIFLDFYSEEKMIKYRENNLEKLKEKSFLKFVLKQGVLGWGIPVGIFVGITIIISNYNRLSFPRDIYRFILFIIIFSISGIVLGMIKWFVSPNKNK